MYFGNIKIGICLFAAACCSALAEQQADKPARAETEIASAKESVELRLKLAEQKEIFADKKAALESRITALSGLIATAKSETLKTLEKSKDNSKTVECLREEVSSKKALLKELSNFLDARKDALIKEISSHSGFKNSCADIIKTLDEDFLMAKNDCPSKLKALFKAVDKMLERDFEFSQDADFAYLGLCVKIPKESGKIPAVAQLQKEGK